MPLEDLEAKLRSHCVEDVKDVAKAYLESDGEITVIRRGDRRETRPPRKARSIPG
ncbi:MAG: YetF domain-containing protein [Betaproteobacteria bacterium]